MSLASMPRGSALIADDELSNRVILKSLLTKLGYGVIQAENGARAVELFEQQHPTLVLMDVMMPIMDGYEATKRIKLLAGDRFVPVIFLTAITDEAALSRCIHVGGDDYLTKPYSHMTLATKVLAMERIQSLHDDLRLLYSRMQREEEIAEQVFSEAVMADNVALEQIRTFLKPASVFSGDILLSAYSPSRDLHVLLGDFTGHGLSAALGAMPTSEVFRSMTAKGYLPEQILDAINHKLCGLLPTGMFLAAQFVKVSHTLEHITVINCGMPDLFVLDKESGAIRETLVSKSIPLGITKDQGYNRACQHITIRPGERILLATDGVTEARNTEGEYFGSERFKRAVAGDRGHAYLMDEVIAELEAFCLDAPQDDDITLVEIPLIPPLLPDWISARGWTAKPVIADEYCLPDDAGNGIEFAITLNGSQLRQTNPVPLLINYLQDTTSLHQHRESLFTILTELFVNALDHGVLGLDSSLKEQEDGVNRYFEQRERLLCSLEEGQVRIALHVQPTHDGGYVLIHVEDSGRGFDLKRLDCLTLGQCNSSGRGITLIVNLCESIKYLPPGNRVEVMYRWLDSD